MCCGPSLKTFLGLWPAFCVLCSPPCLQAVRPACPGCVREGLQAERANGHETVDLWTQELEQFHLLETGSVWRTASLCVTFLYPNAADRHVDGTSENEEKFLAEGTFFFCTSYHQCSERVSAPEFHMGPLANNTSLQVHGSSHPSGISKLLSRSDFSKLDDCPALPPQSHSRVKAIRVPSKQKRPFTVPNDSVWEFHRGWGCITHLYSAWTASTGPGFGLQCHKINNLEFCYQLLWTDM